jgi:hypothetical protein
MTMVNQDPRLMCYKSSTLKRRCWLAVAAWTVIVTTGLATPAWSADETAPAFIARLLAAVASGNRRAAAGMFRYPLRVNSPMLPYPIPLDNTSSTLQMYDLLFTPEMRCALDMAEVPQPGRSRPKYPLIATDSTLNLGQGLIVAERASGAFKITRMTLIGAPEGHKPGTPVAGTEIDLKFGGMVRQVAGNLAGDGFDRYTVTMTRGSVLQAKLERFKGLDAVLRVTDSRGRAVDAKADGKRTWASPIPVSGNYRVDVVRKAPFCDPPLTYLLTLSVK